MHAREEVMYTWFVFLSACLVLCLSHFLPLGVPKKSYQQVWGYAGLILKGATFKMYDIITKWVSQYALVSKLHGGSAH